MSEIEIKLPFTQTVGIIIAVATIIIALGGYILFFQSKSHLKTQIKAAEELKEKYSLSDKMLADMKTKYDNVYDDMKKIMDELQNTKQKYQDCTAKLNSLESTYDALTRKSEASNAATPTPAAPTENVPQPAPSSSSNAPAITPTSPR